MRDIKNEDQRRWVEVPDDFTRTRLKDLTCDDNARELIVEYFDVETNTWPMAKTDKTWENFQVGDIIDVKVR